MQRQIQEKHAELVVQREKVPAEVRASCTAVLEAARPSAEAASAPSTQEELPLDVEALSSRVESVSADLGELKVQLGEQLAQLEETAKAAQMASASADGSKMDAKAAAAVAGSTSRHPMRGSQGGARHAPY